MSWDASFIFFPDPFPAGDWHPPGLELEDANFQAADGTRLHGWFVPHPRPRAVLLLAHGNAGNLTGRVHLLRLFHRLGVATLIFDYRGYGKSLGTPDEAGILQDARAARRWLANRAGLAEDQIVLCGESLGGAVAVDLASTEGARGLILLSSFTSIVDVARAHLSWFPAGLLLSTRLDSLAKIGQYRGPVLIGHSDADEIVPYDQARRLLAALEQIEKRLVTFHGLGHNDLPPPEFVAALDQFFAELPDHPPRS